MTCQNYQLSPKNSQYTPKTQESETTAIIKMGLLASLFTLAVILIVPKIKAADKCKDISDLDERNSCYEKEKQAQQKDYESTAKKLTDIKSKKDAINSKISALGSQLDVTQAQIDDVQKDIDSTEKELAVINANLQDRKGSLEEKTNLRNKLIRDYSKRSSLETLEAFLLAENNLNGFQLGSFSYIFNKTISNETLKIIFSINTEIDSFEKDKQKGLALKADLEDSQKKMAALVAQLQAQKQSAQSERDNLQKLEGSFERELSNINSKIADLNSKQQAILREKYGSESETVGDYENASSDLPNPSFSPAFAFYSYGYPHRVGMSQYGAYGRAKAGQKYDTILKAYFKNIKIEDFWDDSKKIPVQGYGNISMRDYLYGLGEMPESWGNNGGYEALKAQVVAARTYALNYIYYTWDGKSGTFKEKSPTTICTTQSCQVYTGGKKTGKWKQAVDDTEGMVITYGGKPITAWYASTAGGYTRSAGDVWGSNRPWAEGISDLACSSGITNCAYDGPKYGNSPWFHKAWNSGYSAKNAWMTEEEVEDTVNAYLLWKQNSANVKYLSPPSKDGNAYDYKELREKLGSKQVGKIKEIKAYDDGHGYTSKVVVKSDNYSNLEINGYDFRTIFNLRSRERLYIYSGFFSIRTEN